MVCLKNIVQHLAEPEKNIGSHELLQFKRNFQGTVHFRQQPQRICKCALNILNQRMPALDI